MPERFKRVKTSRRGRAGGGRSARGAALAILALSLLLSSCNPVYVARAGWAQLRILSSRVPLTEVMTDPATDPVTRGKLRLVWDARGYAIDSLGFVNAGQSYTSLARLESDTLALVLSAAYQDRLAFRTWWFPIVGRVPYRAYFSLEAAERARDDPEADGFDTYLRPTAAFSTLGWFADPLYSTLLRLDEVDLVETVLHELAHNHLYIPGGGRFNEAWANFAGHISAIEFFCNRSGGSPDSVKCRRARERWEDAQDIARFVDEVENEILALYARGAGGSEQDGGGRGVPAPNIGENPSAESTLSTEEILILRSEIYSRARETFRSEVQPQLRASGYGYLGSETLNNATLLARSLYFHRLPEFGRLWEEWDGDFASLMSWIREEAPRRGDPFEIIGGRNP
jgi:predicted aminopeptidase